MPLLPSFGASRTAVAVLLGCAAVLAQPGTAHATAVTRDPAQATGGWLGTQLVDGDHIEVAIDLNGDGQITDDERFPDYGLTADTVIALAAASVGGNSSAAATDYLEANIEAYVGDADVDDDGVDDPDGEYYAGALGKALLVAAVTGRDGTDFGGVDLVARLLFTETPQGRFADVSAYGDFSNDLGQSLATLALVRTAPALLSPAVIAFLPGQQCRDSGPRDGNVPVTIGADPCAAASVSVDTTGFAVQAMLAVGKRAAGAAGLGFLVRDQRTDGGFTDQAVENANSTGVAAQALRVGGRDRAADDAVTWLEARQVGCGSPAEQQGAIAFGDGPDGKPLYDDRATRASAQAVPGLTGIGVLSIQARGSAPDAPRLDCPDTTPPPPTPTATATPPTASPTATGTSNPAEAGLPATGTDIGPLLWAGGLSLLLGGGLLLAGRRRRGQHR